MQGDQSSPHIQEKENRSTGVDKNLSTYGSGAPACLKRLANVVTSSQTPGIGTPLIKVQKCTLEKTTPELSKNYKIHLASFYATVTKSPY